MAWDFEKAVLEGVREMVVVWPERVIIAPLLRSVVGGEGQPVLEWRDVGDDVARLTVYVSDGYVKLAYNPGGSCGDYVCREVVELANPACFDEVDVALARWGFR